MRWNTNLKESEESSSLGLVRNMWGEAGSNHLIWGLMQWELQWCRKTCVWKKMVPKHELFESIPLHGQGLNYITNICELEDHVGEKGWSLNWLTKFGLAKKNSPCKFSQSLIRKCLSQICISLCLITPPRGSKTRHHWGSKRNKCQVATLYRSCVSLSNRKRNATCTSHCRMVGMRLYKQGWQKPKWKDLKTSNVETQVQANVDGVGVREGIRLGWSQRFGLDKLDVWQKCW
jgi:hypothetical protein